MTNVRQIRWTGLPVFLLLVAVPLLIGPGCPPPNLISPNGSAGTSGTGDDDDSGQPIPPNGSNVAPYFEFTRPLSTIMREVGDLVEIAWLDGDPDDNAVITLMLDPDEIYGNGTEILLQANIMEDTDGSQGRYILDTRAKNLQPAEYRIIASITDGKHAADLIVAPGLLQLFPPGMVPGNISPTVVVTEPDVNYGVGQNDQVPINWCVTDPDDGENQVLPDIVVLIDLDQNPTNDLVLTGLDAESVLAEICYAVTDPADGPYPIVVNGQVRAYVLGCFKDSLGGQADACANPVANGTGFPPNGTYTINVMKLPPRLDGEPYRVRVTAWDHTNGPVSRYARGSISVSGTATGGAGLVDLGQVGRTIRGTKFYGFDEGGLAGYTGTGVGDMDGDGVEDFAIVSRFGRSYGLNKAGAVHLIFGMSNREFGSEVPLNSVTTTYRGAIFTLYDSLYDTWDWMGGTEPPRNDGIVSIARVDDVTGDGRPEFIVGLPFVERLYDRIDDDPCDCSPTSCYADGLPNPVCDSGEYDPMGISDWHERVIPFDPPTDPPTGYMCSNDMDLNVETPIMGGYAILVGSNNALSNQVYALEDMGQVIVNNESVYKGARFRGSYLDYFRGWDYPDTDPNQKYPYVIEPDNAFGTTVSSMPQITNSVLGGTARHGGRPVISMPMGARGRGIVWNMAVADYTTTAPDVQSYPWFGCPGGRAIFLPQIAEYGPLLISGERDGDMLGYGAPAGDLNRDGLQDLACGAPGADRDGLTDNGVVYAIFGRPDFTTPDNAWDIFEYDLQIWNHPRLEIHGTHSNDRFGMVQTTIGDINQDGVADVAFASQYAGSDGMGGPESGFIGIVFGGVHLSGVNKFTTDHVAGPTLPGVRIYGRQAGGHAGAVINNVGDFNADGIDDLAIVAPDEIRIINGLRRQGVAYLLFGGPHLANKTINLSQVGSTVPGLVFVTPYIMTDADAAPITWASGAGDVNGDGFEDLLIGIPNADTVYPLNPSQRKLDTGEMYLIYGSNSGSNGMGW